MPLLQAAQAQKHVTVNEALTLLDGLCQITLGSISRTDPPAAPVEGQAWAVPAGASGAWDGAAGHVALFSNGGWRFVAPRYGWRAVVLDSGRQAIHDGTEWREGALAVAASGASCGVEIVETEVEITPGATVYSDPVLPANSVVIGVTGRVTETITGTLATWRLGVAAGSNRYGSGLGTSSGSWVRGLTDKPQTYYDDTPLQLKSEDGMFEAGRVLLAVHALTLGLPRS